MYSPHWRGVEHALLAILEESVIIPVYCVFLRFTYLSAHSRDQPPTAEYAQTATSELHRPLLQNHCRFCHHRKIMITRPTKWTDKAAALCYTAMW